MCNQAAITLLHLFNVLKGRECSLLKSSFNLRKEIVKGIHDEFLAKNIEGLTEMTRDEFRSINLYFINRIDYQDKIYKVLKEHKDKISEKYLRY